MMVVGDGWVVVEGLHLDPTVLASLEWSAGGAQAGTGPSVLEILGQLHRLN